EELRTLRKKGQGDDHWETISQDYAVDTLKRVAVLSPDDRSRWRKGAEGAKQAAELAAKGRYAPARPLWEEWLAVCQHALGENNLAYNLSAQGKDADAQPLYQKALDSWRQAFGEGHPDTAMGYNNLAADLGAQGRYAEAQPLFQKSLDILQEALGEHHPN